MLALGCDHGGYQLKEFLKKYLEKKGIEVKDFGTFDGAAVDYPEIALKVAGAITGGECKLGILVCGTGIGMSLAANKVKGIRAALCCDTHAAEMTRRHNNANILCMGGLVISEQTGLDIVDTFLSFEFEGGRHQRRVDQIAAIENGEM